MKGANDPQRLVIATHNKGKLVEMGDLLAPYGFACVSAGELGLPEPEETATTFIGNAELKAEAAMRGSNLPSLADDSGIVVEALDGAPGIYSARWAETNGKRDFGYAMQRVNDELGASANRRAYFISVLSFAVPGQPIRSFEGRVHGTLAWPPRGTRGFGYDPMFLAEGYAQTFGEMEPLAKHAISHRAIAFRKLVEGMGWKAAPGTIPAMTVLKGEPR